LINSKNKSKKNKNENTSENSEKRKNKNKTNQIQNPGSLDECLNEALATNSLLARRARGHLTKRQKLEHNGALLPIIFTTVHASPEKMYKVLLDSGASGSIACSESIPAIKAKGSASTIWNTAAGSFTTLLAKTTIDLVFLEFSLSQVVHAQLHVTAECLSGYDLILGCDMLSALGIILDFSRDMIIWEEGKMPMKPRDSTRENSFFVKEPNALHEEADKMSKTLDAKYQKADLKNIAEITRGLTEEQQTQLWQFLNKYENIFDGTLDNWKGADCSIEL
jgi:hypothetical protein